MNRLRKAAVIGAGSIAIVLSGCAAEPVPSADVQEWLDGLDIDGGDELAVFRGGTALDWGDDDAILAGFGDDVEATLTSADVYCFGEDRVSVQLRLEGATSSTTIREEDVPCDENPHVIELSLDDATAVGATAISAEGVAGWAVAVRGTEN
jgi:hypothetical protein